MTYTFKTRPYEHQRTALQRAIGRQGYAYLMEMGTGKTKVMIDEMGIMHDSGQIDCAIIIAPKGVYRNWVRELATHCGTDYIVDYWESGGGSKTKQAALEKHLTPRSDRKLRILLVNVEALSQSGGIADKYITRFAKSGRCYIGLDESTTIKNPTATRTKNIIKLGRLCVVRRIATGSPTPNSPLDLFSQFEFLGPGLLGSTSYFNFRARHAMMQQKDFGGRKVQIVVGYRNVEALTGLVEGHSYRVLKEECLDLPAKVYRMVDVDLTDEQRRLYRQMKDEAFADLAGGAFVSSQSAITTLLRLQQMLCGHVGDADGNVHPVASNRVDVLMQELEGVRGAAIIWSRFRHEIAAISEAIRANYGEDSLAQFHGGNTGTREADAQRFIDDDKCRFMVSTQQSGGYGNTWLKGTSTFYASNSFNLEHRLQSEDRAHRSGQTEKCTYTDLCAVGTVDEKLISALRAKINIAETIMGDNPRDWLV